jgi:hypothetical protein
MQTLITSSNKGERARPRRALAGQLAEAIPVGLGRDAPAAGEVTAEHHGREPARRTSGRAPFLSATACSLSPTAVRNWARDRASASRTAAACPPTSSPNTRRQPGGKRYGVNDRSVADERTARKSGASPGLGLTAWRDRCERGRHALGAHRSPPPVVARGRDHDHRCGSRCAYSCLPDDRDELARRATGRAGLRRVTSWTRPDLLAHVRPNDGRARPAPIDPADRVPAELQRATARYPAPALTRTTGSAALRVTVFVM